MTTTQRPASPLCGVGAPASSVCAKGSSVAEADAMGERPAKKKRRRKKDDDDLGAVVPSWSRLGKCDATLDWFSQDKKTWRECQKVCNSGCPVRKECLVFALETKQTYGVWGGCDPRRLREALGLNAKGEVHDYPWRLHCPNCASLEIEHTPTDTRKLENCKCEKCGLRWQRQLVGRRRRKKPKSDG